MTTLSEVRDALEAKLDAIEGLRAIAYVPDDTPGGPVAVVYPPVNADYSDDFGDGSFTVTFIVMLMIPAAIDRKQLDLYELLDRVGTRSIFATIQADRTLGGLDVDCRVVSATDPLARGQMATTQVFQRAITVQAIVS